MMTTDQREKNQEPGCHRTRFFSLNLTEAKGIHGKTPALSLSFQRDNIELGMFKFYTR